MNKTRLLKTMALAGLLGAAVILVFVAVGTNSTRSGVHEEIANAITDGSTLYLKVEIYNPGGTLIPEGDVDVVANHPETIVSEAWFDIAPGGEFLGARGLISSVDGTPLIKSLVALDSATHTDLTNGRSWTTPRDLEVDNTLDWLDHRFAQPERLKAHGFDDRLSTLDGVPSSVYTAESVVPDGILLVEKELVNGNPLIGQEHHWLADPDDRSSKTLIRTVRHLDYRVVPKE